MENHEGVPKLKDKHIMIAVDDSENAKNALLFVAGFIGGFRGFRATILSVMAAPDRDLFDSDEERQEWIEDKRVSLLNMLERYRQILIQAGFPKTKIRTELVAGDGRPVSSVILEKQKEVRSCALVVGRRGISKSEEFLFGSVSNALVHSANNCSVWIIEPTCGLE
jgi:nucleotide-binding universal stress UspA family protein